MKQDRFSVTLLYLLLSVQRKKCLIAWEWWNLQSIWWCLAMGKNTWSSQLIKIGKSDLIDMDCLDQLVEINDVYRFILILPWFHANSKFVDNWVAIEVEGSNNYHFLKNSYFFLKPGLQSSSDGWYLPGLWDILTLYFSCYLHVRTECN